LAFLDGKKTFIQVSVISLFVVHVLAIDSDMIGDRFHPNWQQVHPLIALSIATY
jgi:hypothetical protein